MGQRRGGWAAALVLTACATVPVTPAQMTPARAAILAAEQLGADQVPIAQDHLQFARLRVGEVDVHPQPIERADGRQRRVRVRGEESGAQAEQSEENTEGVHGWKSTASCRAFSEYAGRGVP